MEIGGCVVEPCGLPSDCRVMVRCGGKAWYEAWVRMGAGERGGLIACFFAPLL